MKQINTAGAYYRSALIAFGVIAASGCLLFAGLAAGLSASGADGGSFWYAAAFWLLIWTPFGVYNAAQYRYYKTVTLSNLQSVEPNGTDTSFFRSVGLRATVDFRGTRTAVVTKHVFGAGLAGPNRIDDYIGRTVEIGYNEKKDEWIVTAVQLKP